MSILPNDLIEPFPQEDLLFHYTNSRTAIEHILNNAQIRFNPLTHINDPLEFSDLQHIGISSEGDERLWDAVELGNNTNKERKKIKLACFCTDEINKFEIINRGYSRARMWSQYGENHKGICIVFRKSTLIDDIKGNVSKDVLEKSVTYDNQLKRLNEALTVNGYEAGNRASSRLKQLSDAYIFSKVEDYKDENEYRVILYHEGADQNQPIDVYCNNSIEAVILGCRFPMVYLPTLKEIANRIHFQIYQLHWNNGTPHLDTVVEE